jgi:uncharacterized protein YndB with AHSA1/START domain
MSIRKNSSTVPLSEPDLVIMRIFDAPRELLFKVWTEPRRLEKWWVPRGFTNPVCDLSLQAGGAIRIHMRY